MAGSCRGNGRVACIPVNGSLGAASNGATGGHLRLDHKAAAARPPHQRPLLADGQLLLVRGPKERRPLRGLDLAHGGGVPHELAERLDAVDAAALQQPAPQPRSGRLAAGRTVDDSGLHEEDLHAVVCQDDAVALDCEEADVRHDRQLPAAHATGARKCLDAQHSGAAARPGEPDGPHLREVVVRVGGGHVVHKRLCGGLQRDAGVQTAATAQRTVLREERRGVHLHGVAGVRRNEDVSLNVQLLGKQHHSCKTQGITREKGSGKKANAPPDGKCRLYYLLGFTGPQKSEPCYGPRDERQHWRGTLHC
mmetsp:Transcript_3666/g.9145  ORF Transcript_3666/g.9145 Transcript_3666/m.9145 type:complete len:308 (-) Transcript_3666:31-954(-)